MPASEPRFLNVDLDVESRDALGQLVDALPSLDVMVSARMRGRHVLSLELATPGLSLDQTVRRFAKEISALSGKPRRLWQRATKRCFLNCIRDVGNRSRPNRIHAAFREVRPAPVGPAEIQEVLSADPRKRASDDGFSG
jgi:hypothetical protein